MDAKQRQKTAIVVGAGVGGVSTAARLAKAGFSVTVVEKNSFTGGRCSLIHHDGYRFDQGPSLLLLPQLFVEAFRDLDTSLEAEGVELQKCEPNYRLWFGDGESFDLSTDTAHMKIEVEKWEGEEGFERYLGFLQESHRHYEISLKHVLRKNFTSFLSVMRPDFLRAALHLHVFDSVYNRAAKYFWTERLRRVFTFASMYMGMSPFEAPGTYSLLQYTELAEGVWYPKGGFHKVVEALVNVGKRYGVEYRLSTPISSVALTPDLQRATGVVLESGEQLMADVVVINADLVYAYNHLLPKSKEGISLSKRTSSCSSISFYWAMDRVIPELKVHNIFLANAYRESFDDIFDRQLMPEEPSFYVNVPSRIDPTAAPPDKDSIVVLVPVGHLFDADEGRGINAESRQDWTAMIHKARETVISRIEERTGARRLREAITNESINTPQSWKQTFNLTNGSILGLSHNVLNVLSWRPKTKHPHIQGCFFVGASTHPGTGVPICLAGSKITSEQILDELHMAKPWASKASVPRRGKGQAVDSIDRLEPPPPRLSRVQLVMLALVVAGLVLLFQGRGLGLA